GCSRTGDRGRHVDVLAGTRGRCDLGARDLASHTGWPAEPRREARIDRARAERPSGWVIREAHRCSWVLQTRAMRSMTRDMTERSQPWDAHSYDRSFAY